MTREEVEIKVLDLTRNIQSELQEEVKRLLDSGAIDLDEHEDNYLLPKMLLTVALENHSQQIAPPNSWKKERKIIANLRKI